jgi:hypothetical protein
MIDACINGASICDYESLWFAFGGICAVIIGRIIVPLLGYELVEKKGRRC